jgi:hypothetical protein
MRGDDVESIADGSPRLLDVIEHAEPTIWSLITPAGHRTTSLDK